MPRSEAEDATQEFFADMLRREWLKLADRERGSFRGFLRSSVLLFLKNRRRYTEAQKRGGANVIVPLEAEACEQELSRHVGASTDPAKLYDETWADCVLQVALDRLAIEYEKAGNARYFEHLRPYLTSPPSPGDYTRIAGVLGVQPGQVALRVHRLTQRFAEVIRAEIAATLADQNDVETELRYLLRLASKP